MTIGEFTTAVAQYGMLMNASVTSWGRTKAHNAAVGGVSYSGHRFWLGCDLVYDAPEPPSGVRQETAERLGLKLLVEGDHDHVQPLTWRAG